MAMPVKASPFATNQVDRANAPSIIAIAFGTP
jgi:hypothetical protein